MLTLVFSVSKNKFRGNYLPLKMTRNASNHNTSH